jgi:hypothetical protein
LEDDAEADGDDNDDNDGVDGDDEINASGLYRVSRKVLPGWLSGVVDMGDVASAAMAKVFGAGGGGDSSSGGAGGGSSGMGRSSLTMSVMLDNNYNGDSYGGDGGDGDGNGSTAKTLNCSEYAEHSAVSMSMSVNGFSIKQLMQRGARYGGWSWGHLIGDHGDGGKGDRNSNGQGGLLGASVGLGGGGDYGGSDSSMDISVTMQAIASPACLPVGQGGHALAGAEEQHAAAVWGELGVTGRDLKDAVAHMQGMRLSEWRNVAFSGCPKTYTRTLPHSYCLGLLHAYAPLASGFRSLATVCFCSQATVGARQLCHPSRTTRGLCRKYRAHIAARATQ